MDWKKATSHTSYGVYSCFVCNQEIDYGDHYKALPNRVRAHDSCAERAVA